MVQGKCRSYEISRLVVGLQGTQAMKWFLLILILPTLAFSQRHNRNVIVAAGGAAPPDTAFDNFNRSDGPLGSNWTTVTGLAAPAIVSNQATVGTNNTDNAAYYNAVSPTSNQYAYAVWTSSSGDGGVAARMQSAAATFYLCHIYANFYLNIYEVKEGSLVSRANTTLTISSGDIIRNE